MSDIHLNEIVEATNEALLLRSKEWPHRGEAYEQSHVALEKFAVEIDQWANECPVSLSTNEIEQIKEIFKRPIFIGGSMKSGTTVLTQLLDGHPELVVLPGDSHYWKSREGEVSDEVRLRMIRRMVNPTGQEPYWCLGKTPDHYRIFSSVFKQLSQISHDAFFCYVGAVAKACGRDLNQLKAWVEKTPGNERFINEMLDEYPEGRFIHVLRHPITNAASLLKLGRVRGWNTSMSAVANEIYVSYQSAADHYNGAEQRYQSLKYEELVTDVERKVNDLLGSLDLVQSDLVFKPSSFGQPSTANSMRSKDRVIGQLHQGGLNYQKALEELKHGEKVILISQLSAVMKELEQSWELDVSDYQRPVSRLCYRVLDRLKRTVSGR